MSLADLTFEQWRSSDLPTARRTGREAADRVGGRLARVDAVDHLGGPLHRVIVEREGREFALIPGGTLRLGFDPQGWEPTPEQTADYAESLAEGYGHELGLKEYLAVSLSPPRTVTLETLLMAVEAEALDELPAGIPAVLAARGLRMPSADEWEHACGAGARTLFRWGDTCPLEEPSWGGADGPRSQPNAFGLRIAYDAYAAELSADPGAVHGGDGGEAVCGGYGNLLGWLPLATANRNPSMAEFAYGPDGAGVVEAFSTRPVLSLR
nr:formylglycine-generating enzyme family protein [Streptomyces sp. NBC_00974]